MDTYKLLEQESERQFTRAEDIDLYFSWEAKVSRIDIIKLELEPH